MEPPLQFPTLIPTASNSSGALDLEGTPPRPHLPEHLYLSYTLPTRNLAELRAYLNHCVYLLQHTRERFIHHPLAQLQNITAHPVELAGYLWRYKIVISREGVVEDYRTIVRTNAIPETAVLQKFATVYYPWDGKNWHITLCE